MRIYFNTFTILKNIFNQKQIIRSNKYRYDFHYIILPSIVKGNILNLMISHNWVDDNYIYNIVKSSFKLSGKIQFKVQLFMSKIILF